jgi:hypothetical protein
MELIKLLGYIRIKITLLIKLENVFHTENKIKKIKVSLPLSDG